MIQRTDFSKVEGSIKFEADRDGKLQANADFQCGERLEGQELKQACIQNGNKLLAEWDERSKFDLNMHGEHISHPDDKQRFASIYAQRFYVAYKARFNRLQDEACAAWEAHEYASNR